MIGDFGETKRHALHMRDADFARIELDKGKLAFE